MYKNWDKCKKNHFFVKNKYSATFKTDTLKISKLIKYM